MLLTTVESECKELVSHPYPPLYDINKSYLENAELGPYFNKPYPQRLWPERSAWNNFLGFPLASKLGIPAGPLLNSKWIECAANLGFDLLCYKTIRSAEHQGHPLPNMIYVDQKQQFDPHHLPESVRKSASAPTQMCDIAVTNSFGMPSRSEAYLAEDIPKAYQALHPGQMMIVSVVGTMNHDGYKGFVNDFVKVALQAKNYGAKLIEVNLSCPNVASTEGELYTNPTEVFNLTKKMIQAIGSIPLIAKVGYFKNKETLEKTLIALAQAGVQAVCGINTLSMRVLDSDGNPALGPERLTSGICGNPIRLAALNFIKDTYKYVQKHKLDLQIMGTGGVVSSNHFEDFFNAGAEIAMTATGMIWDPFIGMRYQQKGVT